MLGIEDGGSISVESIEPPAFSMLRIAAVCCKQPERSVDTFGGRHQHVEDFIVDGDSLIVSTIDGRDGCKGWIQRWTLENDRLTGCVDLCRAGDSPKHLLLLRDGRIMWVCALSHGEAVKVPRKRGWLGYCTLVHYVSENNCLVLEFSLEIKNCALFLCDL